MGMRIGRSLLVLYLVCFAALAPNAAAWECPDDPNDHKLFEIRLGDECADRPGYIPFSYGTFEDIWQHRQTDFDIPNVCVDLFVCDLPNLNSFVIRDLSLRDFTLEDFEIGWDLSENSENLAHLNLEMSGDILINFEVLWKDDIVLFGGRTTVSLKDYFFRTDFVIDDKSVPLEEAQISSECRASSSSKALVITFDQPANLVSDFVLKGLEPIIQDIMNYFLKDLICLFMPTSYAEINDMVQGAIDVVENDETCDTGDILLPGEGLRSGLVNYLFRRDKAGEPVIRFDCPHGPWEGEGLSLSVMGDVLQHRDTTFDMREVCGNLDGIIPTLEDYDMFNMWVNDYFLRTANVGYSATHSSGLPTMFIETIDMNAHITGDFDVDMKLFPDLKGEAQLFLRDYLFSVGFGVDDESVPADEAKITSLCDTSTNKHNIEVKLEGRDFKSKAQLAITQPILQGFLTDSLCNFMNDMIFPESLTSVEALLNDPAVQQILEALNLKCYIGAIAEHYYHESQDTVKAALLDVVNRLLHMLADGACGGAPEYPRCPDGVDYSKVDSWDQYLPALNLAAELASVPAGGRLQDDSSVARDSRAQEVSAAREAARERSLEETAKFEEEVKERKETFLREMQIVSEKLAEIKDVHPAEEAEHPAGPVFDETKFLHMRSRKMDPLDADPSHILTSVDAHPQPVEEEADGNSGSSLDTKLAVFLPILGTVVIGLVVLLVKDLRVPFAGEHEDRVDGSGSDNGEWLLSEEGKVRDSMVGLLSSPRESAAGVPSAAGSSHDELPVE
eukprot:Rmarinus@m.232